MVATLVAIWVATHNPAPTESVRIDWLRTVTEPAPVARSTPVRDGRTTCVNRPRPLRPRVRYLARVRRYAGNAAQFVEVEVSAKTYARLELDAIVEVRSLVEEPDGDWWRP